MLVRASVHTAGLRPGQTADLNGNDPAVRAALAAGYLERVADEEAGPGPVEVEPPEDPEPPAGEDATEGDGAEDD